MAIPDPELEAPARPSPSRFAARVMAIGATPDHALTPIEQRLLKLTAELFTCGLTCAQMRGMAAAGWLPGQPTPPITAEVVGEAARFALAAAVEIEQPLRELRDKLEGRGER